MTIEEQKKFIDMVKAATHGLAPDEKRARQDVLLAGACMALSVLDQCPNEWRALLFLGRAQKLFRR